jgi:hypothetical protein
MASARVESFLRGIFRCRWAAPLLLCICARAQAPIGELFATDPGAPAAAQLAGTGMSVLPGSELSAGIAPATLKLARGGQVRICSQSQLTLNSGSQGLLLAMSAGALEVNYRLDESASDLIVTPDFNIRLAGPGVYHFALSVNHSGDTCFKALPGNTAGVVFSEPLGSDLVGIAAEEAAFFPAGKLAGRRALDRSCGCPIAKVPALVANAEPQTSSGTEEGRAQHAPIVSRESGGSSPAEDPAQEHLQVETPFVFSATAASLPGGVAQMDFSVLPNVFLTQDDPDPVVLTVKAGEPVTKPELISAARVPATPQTGKEPKKNKQTKLTVTAPEPVTAPATSAKPEPISVAQVQAPAQATPEPSKEPEKKKQKKSFGSRVKGFFGALFGH